MTRKNPQDVMQVINILKFRGMLDDFDIVPIENKSEAEVAQIMRDSLIFLSFSYAEGFSLPAAEAMACGSIVIGYHGMGGKEFFDPAFSYPIQNADIIAFAQAVEEVIKEYNNNPHIFEKKGQQASEYILKTYTTEKEKEDIRTFWNEICG